MQQESEFQLIGSKNTKNTLINLELQTSTPILAYVNFEKLFKLHTDASVLAIGAVLYQEQDGVEKVISYASQSLSKLE